MKVAVAVDARADAYGKGRGAQRRFDARRSCAEERGRPGRAPPSFARSRGDSEAAGSGDRNRLLRELDLAEDMACTLAEYGGYGAITVERDVGPGGLGLSSSITGETHDGDENHEHNRAVRRTQQRQRLHSQQ